MTKKSYEFTIHQKAALIDYGKPVLIAASAGSGKTLIMVERILKYLEEPNQKTKELGDLDKIIVLTFTNAAAAEMKSRLIKKLAQKIQEGSGDIILHFRKQIEKINNAMIGTIDSFCKTIYSKYFERINLDANLSILEPIEDEAYIYQTIEEKIEDYISSSNNKYQYIFDALSDNRNFNNLKEYTYKVIEHMSLFPKLDEFPKAKSLDELIVLGKEISFFTSNDENKMLNLAQDKRYTDLENQFIKELIGFAKECMVESIKVKQERGVASFSDIERYAYDILSKDNCAKELAKNIDMIFVDEYQDTNEMQEAIIDTFGIQRLFYVGDIKQSIYRFRNAEPAIFERRLRKYNENIKEEDIKNIKHENDYKKIYKDSNGVVIYFDENFRSSNQITDFVNAIFAKNMTESFGKVDYAKTSMMKGLKIEYDATLPVITINNTSKENLTFRNKDVEAYGKPYSVIDAFKDEALKQKQEIALARSSIEFQVIDYIKKALGKKIDDGKSVREIGYGDFAILVRSSKAAKGIIEAFNQEQIPYESFLSLEEENEDVALFVALLKILDNPYQDIPLIQVLLSSFGDFSNEELAMIRKAYTEDRPKIEGEDANKDRENFFEAFFGYSRDDLIKKKISNFNKFLDKYRDKSLSLDVAELIMSIATETGYDAVMMYESVYRIEFFNSFVYYLRGKEIAKTIKAFLFAIQDGNLSSVLDEMMKVNFKDDCVKIMTIHKSKGLEFPIVIFPEATRTHYHYSLKGLEYHVNLGYGVQVKDANQRLKTSTFKNMLIGYQNKLEEYEEEMRVYYVALTRAQNHLFILYNDKQGLKQTDVAPEKCTDLEKLLRNSFDEISQTEVHFDLNLKGENIEVDDNKMFVKDFYKPKNASDQAEKKFEYEYPYENTKTFQSKYSASALKRPEIKENSKKIKVSVDKGKSKDKGIAYHKVLELIDFNKTSLADINAQVDDFDKRGLIDKKDINAELIHNIVNWDVFDSVREGKAKLLREQRFYYRDKANKLKDVLGKDAPEDKITIQGIIDAVIVCGDEAIVIDYKYSSKDETSLLELYTEQVNIYKLALENILNLKVTKAFIYSIDKGEKTSVV